MKCEKSVREKLMGDAVWNIPSTSGERVSLYVLAFLVAFWRGLGFRSQQVGNTFRGFVESAIDCHVRDLIDLYSLAVQCIWSFEKWLGGRRTSCCTSETVAFGEEVQTEDTGNVTIDSCDEDGLAVTLWNRHICCLVSNYRRREKIDCRKWSEVCFIKSGRISLEMDESKKRSAKATSIK